MNSVIKKNLEIFLSLINLKLRIIQRVIKLNYIIKFLKFFKKKTIKKNNN
jgi:hypothetical protein